MADLRNKLLFIRGKQIIIDASKHYSFWLSYENNEWEPNTFSLFDRFITSNSVFLDIGAWIGPTTLYGAQKALRTFSFEPDPVAYAELEKNLSKNIDHDWAKRTEIFNKAITSKGGKVVIGNIDKAGNSSSSLLFSDENLVWEVDSFTLHGFITEQELLNDEIFIKMDIEGGEYDLLPASKEIFNRCPNIVLFLSVHPSFLMSSLRKKKTGLLNKLCRRVIFLYKNYILIRSLPFKYIYDNNGIFINLYLKLLKSTITLKFPEEIIASNKKWIQDKVL